MYNQSQHIPEVCMYKYIFVYMCVCMYLCICVLNMLSICSVNNYPVQSR